MTRKRRIVAGAALALTVGAGAQVAVYANAPSTATVSATWAFTPKNVDEVRDRAKQIVLARVESVAAGPDIVTSQPGEPDGVDRIPTRRVTVSVVKAYKGAAAVGQQLTVFQTGGVLQGAEPQGKKDGSTRVQQVVLEGDPAYKEGEQYLLMLEAGPAGTVRPVSPEGRYRYDPRTDGLGSVVKNPVASQVASNRLGTLEPTLRR